MHLFIKAQQDQCLFLFFCFSSSYLRSSPKHPRDPVVTKMGHPRRRRSKQVEARTHEHTPNVQGTTAEGIYRTRASRLPTCSDLLSNHDHNTERSGDAGEIPSGMPPRLRASRQEFLPASTVCCTSGSTQPVKKKKVLPGDWRKWAHFSSQTAPDLWLS